LNHGYSLNYTPVLRNPRLFHQNTARSTPVNYPTIHQIPPRPTTNLYHPLSPYTLQAPSMVQSSSPYSPQPYPYYPVPPRSAVLSPLPLSSYSVPSVSYEPTVSSNGLALILIATLILVALDLAIVRPQKR